MTGLTLALLHYHYLFMPELQSAVQGHNHGVSQGWYAAGARGLVLTVMVEGPSPSIQPRKLHFRWDKQGAALAKAQLVVHSYCIASDRCYSLLERKRDVT